MSPCAESAANLICHEYPRPSVALCLSGSARTFIQPAVHRSIRVNVIDAFGGDLTLFAAIRKDDARGDATLPRAASVHTTVSEVEAVLALMGAERQNVRIAGGVRHDRETPSCHMQSIERDGERGPDLLESLAGQLDGRAACMGLIERSERRLRGRFNFIIAMRPDMAWPLPVRPYCFWDLTKSIRKWDWVYMGPRDHADVWLKLAAEDFFSCKRVHQGIPEEWHGHYFHQVASQEAEDLSAMIVRGHAMSGMRGNLNCDHFNQRPSYRACDLMLDFNECANDPQRLNRSKFDHIYLPKPRPNWVYKSTEGMDYGMRTPDR
jgi:hypothetical protein